MGEVEAAESAAKGGNRYMDSSLLNELLLEFIKIYAWSVRDDGFDKPKVNGIEDTRATGLLDADLRVAGCLVVAVALEYPIDDCLTNAEKAADCPHRQPSLVSENGDSRLEVVRDWCGHWGFGVLIQTNHNSNFLILIFHTVLQSAVMP